MRDALRESVTRLEALQEVGAVLSCPVRYNKKPAAVMRGVPRGGAPRESLTRLEALQGASSTALHWRPVTAAAPPAYSWPKAEVFLTQLVTTYTTGTLAGRAEGQCDVRGVLKGRRRRARAARRQQAAAG